MSSLLCLNRALRARTVRLALLGWSAPHPATGLPALRTRCRAAPPPPLAAPCVGQPWALCAGVRWCLGMGSLGGASGAAHQ